jgi:hypothetical protein
MEDKMTKVRCDRCGKEEIINATQGEIKIIKIQIQDEKIMYRDLCEKCVEGLLKYVSGSE